MAKKTVKPQFSYQKPFPHRAFVRTKTTSEPFFPGSVKASQGTSKWQLAIHAGDPTIPPEMHKKMDIHDQGEPGESNFIGWATGSITKGREYEGGIGSSGTMWVDEVQSDIVQKSPEYQDPETYRAGVTGKIATSSGEAAALNDELAALKKEFADSEAYMPLARRLEIQQRVGEIEAELPQLLKGYDKTPKYPEFTPYRNRIESVYKKWVRAFFNAILDYAKQQGVKYLAINTAENVDRLTGGRTGKRDLFNRVYDHTAQRWGMRHMKDVEAQNVRKRSTPIRVEDWWFSPVDRLKPLTK